MVPVIEHCELGGHWVEGLFIVNEVFVYLALQVGSPEATIRARIIEAHGYCRRPPKSGETVICMDGHLYAVDDAAICTMQRLIFFVSVAAVHAIIGAYLVEENGDTDRAASIYLDSEVHPYVVIAVLNTLRDEGRLPTHPSWS